MWDRKSMELWGTGKSAQKRECHCSAAKQSKGADSGGMQGLTVSVVN